MYFINIASDSVVLKEFLFQSEHFIILSFLINHILGGAAIFQFLVFPMITKYINDYCLTTNYPKT
jgi:hypothetical protein